MVGYWCLDIGKFAWALRWIHQETKKKREVSRKQLDRCRFQCWISWVLDLKLAHILRQRMLLSLITFRVNLMWIINSDRLYLLNMLYIDLRPGQIGHFKDGGSAYSIGVGELGWQYGRGKIPQYSHRLMHRERVTCELHDSYFRLMTIKHATA